VAFYFFSPYIAAGLFSRRVTSLAHIDPMYVRAAVAEGIK